MDSLSTLWPKTIALVREHKAGAFVAVVAFAAWIAVPILSPVIANGLEQLFGDEALAPAGQFGDQYGSFNALVSTLAMLALIYTIIQQRTELRRAEARWSEERSDLSRQHRADMVMRMVDRLVGFRSSLERFRTYGTAVAATETNVATSVGYIREHYAQEAGKVGQVVQTDIPKFLPAVYRILFDKYARAECHAYISLLRAASRLIRSSPDDERAGYCFLIASTMGPDEAFLAAYHALLDPDIATLTSSIYKLNAMPRFTLIDPSHEPVLRSVE